MEGSTAFGEWPKNSREARGRRGDPSGMTPAFWDADTEQIGLELSAFSQLQLLSDPIQSVPAFHSTFKPQYTATDQPTHQTAARPPCPSPSRKPIAPAAHLPAARPHFSRRAMDRLTQLVLGVNSLSNDQIYLGDFLLKRLEQIGVKTMFVSLGRTPDGLPRSVARISG